MSTRRLAWGKMTYQSWHCGFKGWGELKGYVRRLYYTHFTDEELGYWVQQQQQQLSALAADFPPAGVACELREINAAFPEGLWESQPSSLPRHWEQRAPLWQP